MRKLLAFIGLAAVLVMPTAAMAVSAVTGSGVTLAKGDNRTGTYYAAGQSVTINGDVDGDVICAGQTVEINGGVSGDVICVGQTVTVNGPVTGSVRVAGQIVTINGTVGRNVTSAGQTLTLGGNAHVLGDVAIAGQTVSVSGPLDRDAFIGTTLLTMAGTVGGDLTYMSNKELKIDKSKVKGKVTRQLITQHKASENPVADRLRSLLYWAVASVIVMFAVIWAAPRLVRSVGLTMITQPGTTIGLGALGLVVGPIVMFILALTVIGFPLGVLISVLWVGAILCANMFAGVSVGLMALGRKETGLKQLAIAALAGVPLVLILSWLPFIGVFANLLAVAWTMGGLLVAANKARVAR